MTFSDNSDHLNDSGDLPSVPETPARRDDSPWWAAASPGTQTQPATPADAPFDGQTIAPAPLPARSPWRRRGLAAAAVVAISLGSGTAGAVIAREAGPSSTAAASIGAPAAPAALSSSTSPTQSLAKVAAAVAPSVVSITVESQSGSGEGSGIVLDTDGTILTNNHVVEGAAGGAGKLTVKLSDGRSAAATIVGRDPSTDLAVIRVSGLTGLTAATLGNSSSLHVGDTVLAIGSPLGLDGSVTSGIVSALHRQVRLGSSEQSNPFGSGTAQTQASVGDAIQTDAAVNPGNSGGALVDVNGRVVGVNSAIATLGSTGGGQSGSIGLGFAIPVDEAKTVAGALIAGKTPERAVLGVSVADSPDGGALIASVNPGSAAEAAGLKEGDVVTSFGGAQIGDGSDLSAAVRSHKVGEKVKLTLTRNGSTTTLTATLGSANAA